MAYLVELTGRAERDLTYLFERISASDSAAAASWFNGLEKAIHALERFPRRCPMAPEEKSAKPATTAFALRLETRRVSRHF